MGSATSFPRHEIEADFCVVGGGMAGVCAALAAARNGAKTVLIQDRPVLGGNASSEIRMHICGAHGADNKEAGILEELMLENRYCNAGGLFSMWDHMLYGKCLEQNNLTVLLNCAVHDVAVEGGRIGSVIAWHLTQQCFYHVGARLFADCSGDSVLRISGADCRRGREGRDEFGESIAPEKADGATMGNSILIQLRETDRHVPFISPPWAYKFREGDFPYRSFQPNEGNFWWLEVGGLQDTIADADAIRDELLKIAYGAWECIKNHPDGRGHNWELDWIGSLPGKRESFRYVGDHILTQEDVRTARFEDIVAYGGWPMDDHHPAGLRHQGPATIFHEAPSPFGIPYRCLYSRNIENLLFAGRNISATHAAFSSTRVMATCAIMGQAVGTAAAIATAGGLTPRGVGEQRIAQLQATLMDQDCYLPGRVREIPACCREAELRCSNGDAEALRNGIERDLAGRDNGWWGAPGDWAAYTWTAPRKLDSVRLVLDSDFSDVKRMPHNYPTGVGPAAMPAALARDFDVEMRDGAGNWRPAAAMHDNHRRLLVLEPPADPATGCRVRIVRAWGPDRAHVFAFEAS